MWRSEAQGVSIQVPILKVLASHDSGRATTASLKRDIAILTASGPEWSARMRRLAGRVGTIDILASGYALCDENGWEITANGRDFLRALEAVTQDNRRAEAGQPEPDDAENIARPRAALIVIGHRFKTRRR
jgi:nucleotide-binding universal stress UspA family protein